MKLRYLAFFAGIGLLAAFLASCGPSTPSKPAAQPTPTKASGGGDPVAAGKELFVAKGCIACHHASVVDGSAPAVGSIGPNLDGVASRPKIIPDVNLDNTPANLRKWLTNPPAVKPATLMPNLGLTGDEMDKLIAFLQTLK